MPPPATTSVAVSAGAAAVTAALGTIYTGYSGSVGLPAATSGSGTASLSLASGDTAVLASSARLPKAIGGSLDPKAYVTVTTSATIAFAAFPSFAFIVPASLALPAGASFYLAYNPGNVAGGWSTLAGPATIVNSTVSFAAAPGPVTFSAGTTYAFALFATAQTLVAATPSPSPTPTARATATPTPSPTATATANVAFNCPTSQTASFARNVSGTQETRRAVNRGAQTAPGNGTTMLAVTYARSVASGASVQVAARERAANANVISSTDYARLGVTVRVLAVPAESAAQAQVTLRAQPGVQAVSVTATRRYPTRVTTPYFTNDPYYIGVNPAAQLLPYRSSPALPGQWDMHAIGLENAMAYSRSGNGSGLTNANALGSAGVKIAIIDTGEDATHPELSSQIAYQHCFVTNLAGTSQSSGAFAIDPNGHGTDVSGIAAAAPNNALGFIGTGGLAKIYAYRVFPTPDDSCESSNPDAQCSADTSDIVSAINDAVAQGVNVISLSLGGGGCISGADTDHAEGAAVNAALAAGVIVVAASGNGGSGNVTAPGCIFGVIAVGATSLDDGTPTGTSGSYTSTLTASATSTSPVEYVAGYSQYGSPSANVHSASAWGIVAPGGDPASVNDTNDLHWIENIWTSTPFDQTYAGSCASDFGTASALDCRTLIAGTSMATPHVAGAVALIVAVNPSYAKSAAMKLLLCSTADDIGDSHQGCGRLNLYRAMATALSDPTLP
jgi:subtilisin family serine protease